MAKRQRPVGDAVIKWLESNPGGIRRDFVKQMRIPCSAKYFQTIAKEHDPEYYGHGNKRRGARKVHKPTRTVTRAPVSTKTFTSSEPSIAISSQHRELEDKVGYLQWCVTGYHNHYVDRLLTELAKDGR